MKKNNLVILLALSLPTFSAYATTAEDVVRCLRGASSNRINEQHQIRDITNAGSRELDYGRNNIYVFPHFDQSIGMTGNNLYYMQGNQVCKVQLPLVSRNEAPGMVWIPGANGSYYRIGKKNFFSMQNVWDPTSNTMRSLPSRTIVGDGQRRNGHVVYDPVTSTWVERSTSRKAEGSGGSLQGSGGSLRGSGGSPNVPRPPRDPEFTGVFGYESIEVSATRPTGEFDLVVQGECQSGRTATFYNEILDSSVNRGTFDTLSRWGMASFKDRDRDRIAACRNMGSDEFRNVVDAAHAASTRASAAPAATSGSNRGSQ